MDILSNGFEQVVDMTFTASIVICIVLILRVFLKRAPKVFSYMLWAVVLFRLLCPVSVTSEFSVFGLIETSMPEHERGEYAPITIETVPGIPENIETEISNPGIDNTMDEIVSPPKDVWQVSAGILAVVWLLGMSALLLYSIAQLFGLKRCLKGAMPFQGNIYLADHIASPFVLGVIVPKIYLPSDLDKSEYEYIILHEKYHIRRGDHIVKIIAYLALCIHWFNPLVWLAFVLMGRDMEMSCDEAVMKKIGTDIRAQYSESLLRFATGQKMVLGMPLAFGEGETKGRVKNVMRYKKPKFWISLIGVLLCLIAGVCLLTNPKTEKDNVVVEEISESKVPGQEENQETEFIASEQEENQEIEYIPSESEEEVTQISITAHIKEVMADRENSLVISSDADEFPGAFILEVSEDVYDIKALEGGESISVIMKKSEDKPLNTLEIYDAIYIKSMENEAKQLPGMNLPAVTEPFTEEVNNLEGVELIFEKYKSSEGDLEIVNFSGKDLEYGEWFDIQMKVEDTWYSLAYITENIAFHAVAYLAPDGETQIKPVNWSYMYGDLPVGEYRIVTKVMDYRAPGDYDEYYIATIFGIY